MALLLVLPFFWSIEEGGVRKKKDVAVRDQLST
jgi:hypothetical protein